MTAERREAKRLALNEQRLMYRHGAAAFAIMLMHALLCLLYYRMGLFALPSPVFCYLLAAYGVGGLAYLLVLRLGLTASRRDRTLSLPFILYALVSFMVAAYYVDEFRVSVVMLFFAALLLVSFRLSATVMMLIAIAASLSYAGVLWLAFRDRGIHLNLSVEVLQWLTFSMIGISFAVTGGGISRLRTRLASKNRQLAAAVDHVRELAIRDDLTGLFNRRHLMEVLARQKALADEGSYPFAVCYVDLDHFKQINDRFGHDWGDRVLQRFALVASTTMREGDYLGRLVGDEFLLVLPQSNAQGAQLVAERLRKHWRDQVFADEGGPAGVSLSVGVAAYVPGESTDDLIQRADEGLYQAKSNGRDQTRVA